MAVSGKLRGGDITQFTWAGREFDIAGEANITYRLAGKNITNNITGRGKKYSLATAKLAGLDSVPIVINQKNKDLEFIQNHSDGEDYPLTISMASGAVYSGDCSAESDIDANTGEAQVEVSFRSENLEQI